MSVTTAASGCANGVRFGVLFVQKKTNRGFAKNAMKGQTFYVKVAKTTISGNVSCIDWVECLSRIVGLSQLAFM